MAWKPKKKGKIYCSPACGRGCTLREYKQACSSGKKLAAKLKNIDTDVKGGKWKVEIHENLGWHFRVSKGLVSVYEYSFRQYAACLNAAGPWGKSLWRQGKTPKLAVRRLLSHAREELKGMVELGQRLKEKK